MDPDRFETLLVHGSLAPGEESMADLAEREGAETLFLPTLTQPIDPMADARALASLIGVIGRFRPDIVHTHTAKAGFVGRAAALARPRRRPKLIHTFHGHVLAGYFGPAKTALYRRLERGLGRRSDALIGVSEATVNDLVRLGVAPRERFRVVRLGLDLEPFARAGDRDGEGLRRELGIGEGDVLLTYVGRIVPIKRIDLLISAFARASAGSPRLRLAIVGDGESRVQAEHLARALNVAARVSFLGYRRDLPRIAAAADAAVLSSDNEGTPVSLIEAAAAGRPAVATDVGGVSSIVTRDTGIRVPPGDARRLGEAFREIAADPGRRRRLGANARELALRSYTAERLVRDIGRLYEEVLAEEGR